MKKIISVFVLVSFIFVFSGCATIFTGGKGTVNATSNPKGAEVFINGISYGKTPVRVKLKTKKEYEITFKKAGYKPVTKRITNKVGAGWIILDVIMGLVPVIVDAATGAWYQFDQKTVNAMLERSNEPLLKKKIEEIPIQEIEPAKKEIITEHKTVETPKPIIKKTTPTTNKGITLGMSFLQVKAKLGSPLNRIYEGDRVIYKYKDVVIVFGSNSKVIEIIK